MKNLAILAAVVATLLFSGCSSKDPQIDATEDQAQQAQGVEADQRADQVAVEEESIPGEGMTQGQEDMSESSSNGVLSGDELEALASKMSKIYFDFDKYVIRDDQVARMDAAAEILNSESGSDFTIKVEGNTDEWGTDEYNYALGLKRAKAVKDGLTDRGVDAQRIVLVSYGESNPVCNESNKECWQNNRRVEFKLLP